MPYKIPAAGNRFYVSNGSDLTPNIQSTKNIDMDEEGYLKLSAPFPRLYSEEDSANMGSFIDIIPVGSGDSEYKMVTTIKIFNVDLDDISTSVDSSAPAGNDSARFAGWINSDWYLNTANDIYKLSAPAGTSWSVANTASLDYQEVFVNKNTLVGYSSNSIKQFLTSDMSGGTTGNGVTLNLPGNFRVTGIAYSAYRVGITTQNISRGQAYFFVWNGAGTEAQAGFPVSAPLILDVASYRNGWAMVTSKGEVLYSSGGGYETIGTLPSYYFNANWMLDNPNGEFDHGRLMNVDGDIIYFNIGSLMDSTDDDSGILQGFYSGVWCYDPKVGIYHRYGLSNSKLRQYNVTPASGIYTSVGHMLRTGDKVLYNNAIYYAIYVTDDTFKLATSYDNAVAGTNVSDPSGTMYWIKREDWSQLTSNNQNMGGCMKFDNGSNFKQQGVLPFFAGGQLNTRTLTANNSVCVMAPKFDNIGAVTYYKIKSENIEDTWTSIIVKHRPLFQNDRIIVKAKLQDYYRPFGIGNSGDITPDNYVTWTSTTAFTTTADLSMVLIGHEVEIIAGAAGGSTAHIVSLSLNAGTWTVTLDEEMRAVSGQKSTCIFDSYVKVATITKANQTSNNQFRADLNKTSKWIQVKLELRGMGVAIEETVINNRTIKPII